MKLIAPLRKSAFDAATAAVLDAQYALAERVVNFVRMGVIGVLAIIAAAWWPSLTLELNLVNVAVLAPMVIWSVGQHYLVHRNPQPTALLSFVNPFLDITAVSGLLLGYGLFGSPDLAVKSPIWAAYFIILAGRAITGSPFRAGLAALVAALQYAALAWYFAASGLLQIHDNPLATVSISGTSILDEAAKVILLALSGIVVMYATFWNERTLRRSVESMKASDSRFRAIFEHSAVGIAVLDSSSAILETNAACERFLGSSRASLLGQKLSNFASAEDTGIATGILGEVAGGARRNATAELRFVRPDGEVAWGSMTVSTTEDRQSRRLVAMLGDATERKTLEAQLLHQAFHDPLTQLANRVLFRSRVEHALARRKSAADTIAVLFLDLDNFKTINDTQGHAAGDLLLRAVAERLLNATRGCDTVARLGGDEFAVLLEPVNSGGGPDIVADRIVSAMARPIDTGLGRSVNVGVSLGIATSEHEENPDVLLRNADMAMYEAKGRARGSWLYYDPQMHAFLMNRVTLETDLREALGRNELTLLYQPIVDLPTGRVTSYEALLRWNHPRRGPVSPSTFIPVAEDCGLIVPLGEWVLTEACRQAARWNRRPGGTPITITVNLSSRQIQQDQLEGVVEAVLRDTRLAPECLVLEITETVIMQETENTLERLNSLKRLGIRLAIDDFGTGYSSLSYLQQFPVDILKIDRSFTDALLRGPNEAALVRTIIALANMLGLRSVAEGVEDPEQEAQLKLLGCDAAQGFLFGHPVDSDTVMAVLQGHIRTRVAG